MPRHQIIKSSKIVSIGVRLLIGLLDIYTQTWDVRVTFLMTSPYSNREKKINVQVVVFIG